MGGGSLFHVGEDVEFWRVLVHLSTLAFCLVLFEHALHHLEHKLSHYDKYEHMLRKAYRELMVLGLLSLGLKLLKEVPGIHGDSKTMLAFQVADLSIFILALALILQAIIVFSQLRRHNKMADETELVTSQGLVDAMSTGTASNPREKEIVQRRLLRHLFLRRFGLPQLFPFSKYLRRGQANQISHMIEVEPSMWMLLLAVAWAICGGVALLQMLDTDLPEGHELVEVLVVFAWVLVGLHVAVLLYFRSCMRQLLQAAGYSEDRSVLIENLKAVAEEEAIAWRDETADSALETMNCVQEEQEEVEEERNARRHALLQKDTGFQLIATCCRSIKRAGVAKTRATGSQPGSTDIRLRFFSRKAWHVTVMFLLILNGFFIALLVQCAVYDLDDIYDEFGALPAVMVPLPLALNTFVLQQRIFRHFVMICSIFRVDAATMGEVVNHFSEIVELRSEFATSLRQCLTDGSYTLDNLHSELRSHDPQDTGRVEVDKLRLVLAEFGFRLTRFRFNSVIKLLFELGGTRLEYRQLLRLLTLAQHDSSCENQPGSQRCHPLLQRSKSSLRDGAVNNPRNYTASLPTSRQVPLLALSTAEPSPSDFVNVAGLTGQAAPSHVTESPAREKRRPLLERNYTHQFAGSSSRALHDMFNIRTTSYSPLNTPSSNAAYTVL